MVKGSVYLLKRRCGKAACRCAKGRLHESTVLSASVSGATRLWTIPADRIDQMRVFALRYQRFRTARADLVKLHEHMLRLIDQIEALRRVEP